MFGFILLERLFRLIVLQQLQRLQWLQWRFTLEPRSPLV
jgi:hypothetical protein